MDPTPGYLIPGQGSWNVNFAGFSPGAAYSALLERMGPLWDIGLQRIQTQARHDEPAFQEWLKNRQFARNVTEARTNVDARSAAAALDERARMLRAAEDARLKAEAQDRAASNARIAASMGETQATPYTAIGRTGMSAGGWEDLFRVPEKRQTYGFSVPR